MVPRQLQLLRFRVQHRTDGGVVRQRMLRGGPGARLCGRLDGSGKLPQVAHTLHGTIFSVKHVACCQVRHPVALCYVAMV